MMWPFKNKKDEFGDEVRNLRGEISDLRSLIRRQTDVRVGEWQPYMYIMTDPRPKVNSKEVLLMLLDKLKLKLEYTPALSEGVSLKEVNENLSNI